MLTTDSANFIDHCLIVSALATDCLEASLALMLSQEDAKRSFTLFTLLQRSSIYWIVVPCKNQCLHQQYYIPSQPSLCNHIYSLIISYLYCLCPLQYLMEILKFRAFSSKESQGFIILRRGAVPQLILQDILFQLFEPLFPHVYCPQVYFFSSTDEILRADELGKTKDYIYVHFLERVESYVRGGKVREKIKIGSIEGMARGISFEGTNIYLFSEKQYTMYGRQVFRQTLSRRVRDLSLRQERKLIKYGEYIKQLEQLKDNFEMMKLKDQIKDTVDLYRDRVAQVELNYSRYLKIKGILGTVLKNSGINIQTLSDLK